MENRSAGSMTVELVFGNRARYDRRERYLSLVHIACCSILSDRKGNSIEPHIVYGGVAQLGEHLPCKQGVMGSIPIISTSGKLPRPKLGVITQKLTSPPDGKSAKSVKA